MGGGRERGSRPRREQGRQARRKPGPPPGRRHVRVHDAHGRAEEGRSPTVKVSSLTAKNAPKRMHRELEDHRRAGGHDRGPRQRADPEVAGGQGVQRPARAQRMVARKGKAYRVVYTNEDGGGLRSRSAAAAQRACAADRAAGVAASTSRARTRTAAARSSNCGGADVKPRMESASRPLLRQRPQQPLRAAGGYGQACRTKADAKSNGDLEGWNKNNPGNGRPGRRVHDRARLRRSTSTPSATPSATAAARRSSTIRAMALSRAFDSELKR